MTKTVLVVDDHPLFRKALVGLVEEIPDVTVMEAASGEEGLQKLKLHPVDLVLLDMGLPGLAGVDATSQYRAESEATIVIISASEERREIAAAIRAGASAVVSKGLPMERLREVLLQALDNVLAPAQWIRPSGSLALQDEQGRGLTNRQQEIASLLMDGHSNKEIGMRLGLAEITVKTHLTAIFRLLGVVNRTQAVVAIRRAGMKTYHE